MRAVAAAAALWCARSSLCARDACAHGGYARMKVHRRDCAMRRLDTALCSHIALTVLRCIFRCAARDCRCRRRCWCCCCRSCRRACVRAPCFAPTGITYAPPLTPRYGLSPLCSCAFDTSAAGERRYVSASATWHAPPTSMRARAHLRTHTHTHQTHRALTATPALHSLHQHAIL